MDLRARHVARAAREERREVTRAGADLVHAVVRLHRELLHDPRLDLGLQHRLAVPDRNLEVREREVAMLGGHEELALHLEEQVEDRGIEHVPGADLLLDHVETGLLDVHGVEL